MKLKKSNIILIILTIALLILNFIDYKMLRKYFMSNPVVGMEKIKEASG